MSDEIKLSLESDMKIMPPFSTAFGHFCRFPTAFAVGYKNIADFIGCKQLFLSRTDVKIKKST